MDILSILEVVPCTCTNKLAIIRLMFDPLLVHQSNLAKLALQNFVRNRQAKMVEKYDGIDFGASRVHIQSDEKRKAVAVFSMSRTTKYEYFHADQVRIG